MKITRKLGVSALIAIIIALSAGFYTSAQNHVIPATQLPAEAIAFIKKNFKGLTVTSAKAEKEKSGTKYKAYLSDGTKIEFDSNGEWQDIDGNGNLIPESVLPTTIKAYLDASYKGQHITEIEKEVWGYNTELSNGLELDFDNTGKFLKIDN